MRGTVGAIVLLCLVFVAFRLYRVQQENGLPWLGAARDASSPSIGASAKPAHCEGSPALKVLFIGNSHTEVNDLPSLVRGLACEAGTRIVSQQSTPGGASFIDHAANAETLAKIAADTWDVVVLHDQQQHPSFELQSLDNKHVAALRKIVDAIAANRPNARRIFYMVYGRNGGDPGNCNYYPPLCTFAGETRAIEQGYRLYAERTGGEVAPVARALEAVYSDPRLPLAKPSDLWREDGIHPALATSYLAAAVIVGTMLHAKTVPLDYDGGLPAAVAKYMRTMADAAVNDEQEDPRVPTHEHTRIVCGPTAGCPLSGHGAQVTFELSRDSCASLQAGKASPAARIDTTLVCDATDCGTVPLASWHKALGGTIPNGVYQVRAWIDLNKNGVTDAGDLEACSPENFVVGGDQDLVFNTLATR